jgi:hypothetical protein
MAMNGRRSSFGPHCDANEGIQVLRTDYGFIPSKLSVLGRPELSEFPNRIVFMSLVGSQGVVGTAEATYEPLVSSYRPGTQDSRGESLDYFNRYDPSRANLTIFINRQGPLPFQALKRVDDSLVATVVGEDWSTFFRNLTLLGLTKFEPHESTKHASQAQSGN